MLVEFSDLVQHFYLLLFISLDCCNDKPTCAKIIILLKIPKPRVLMSPPLPALLSAPLLVQ